jgi:hypothetical protein
MLVTNLLKIFLVLIYPTKILLLERKLFVVISQHIIMMKLDYRDMVQERRKVQISCSSSHFSLTKVEQSTFSIEISESNQHFNFQLEQQLKEVFFHGFNDPFANYLESMKQHTCQSIFVR